MKRVELSLPLVALIAGTRGMLGAGLGLLLAGRLSREKRQAVGWTLVAVGAITTLPLVVQVLGGSQEDHGRGEAQRRETGARGERRAAMVTESP